MSLIDNMMEPCVLLTEKRITDPEGGFSSVWEDGPRFKAAIVQDSSMEARIAEQQGVTSVFTITTKRNNVLKYHDVIRRLKDGQTFRVTSDGGEKVSPNASTLDISQVTAEKWALK